MNGIVVSIAIAPKSGEPAMNVTDVRALPGLGLEGDRYFNNARASAGETLPEEQITLIEIEHVEAFNAEYGRSYSAADTRRNIATRGIPLNDLEGREFRIGDVRLKGLELCEPCNYLAKITTPDVLRGLLHKGGLRAQILSEGIIRVGDTIELADGPAVAGQAESAAASGPEEMG